DRIAALSDAVASRRSEMLRRDTLAVLLRGLVEGKSPDPQEFVSLAEFVIKEANDSKPLHFLNAPASHPAHFIACHAITTGRIVARMIRHDPDWQPAAQDAIIAALLKDVGMLAVDAAILACSGPLNDGQKRAVEAHCRVGSELVARYLPATATL